MPAHLAIISRLYPTPYRPHTASFNRQQFQRLARRYRVNLLVPIPWNEWLPHRAELRGERDDDGLTLRYAGWLFPPKLGRALYPLCFALSMVPELGRLRRAAPACLLVSWAYPDAVGGVWLARVLRVPLVIKAHGSDLNLHARPALNARQLRWAASHAAALICVSHALGARAVELGVPADKIRVIHNGVDVERFRPIERGAARAITGRPATTRGELLLFVGNLRTTKGVRELFAAFRSLAGERPELECVMIGEGPESEWLRAQSAAAGLLGRLTLLGSVPHAELGPWFSSADLLCLPSYHEGLPNVVLEAMAAGIPVVATQVGGIPEAVGPEAGELCAPRDADALTAALRRVLERRFDREALARLAQRFSWAANIEATSAVIDRAIASPRVRNGLQNRSTSTTEP
jgi:glycosyltransferase involved in cell wall biosynthesis